MAVFFRKSTQDVERRAITRLPWSVGSDTLNAAVNQERAFRLAPVFASIRLLHDNVSTLPVKGYRRLADERIPMGSPPTLIANLQASGRLVPWLGQCVTSLAARGNAVGMPTSYDKLGFPIEVVWLSMDDVWVDDSTARPTWYWRGRRIDNPQDLIHIPWVSVPGRTLAMSPIETYAASINAGLSAQQFGARWMDNGGVPPGTFRNEAQVVTSDEAETIAQRLVKSIRKGRPLVHGKDWTYTPITIPPEQAQFIETQKLTATQIASIYGVPPEKVGGEQGGSLTYANVEQATIDFVTFTLRPWLVRIETALSARMPERQFVKFNADALVRADTKTRAEVHKIDREIGLRNIDEIRATEDLPPLPGGKGADYTPLSVKAQAPVTPQPPAPADPDRRLSVIRKEATS